MDQLRRAVYRPFPKKDELHYIWFHGFFQWIDGSDAGPIAVIEYEDGHIEEVPPSNITFIDKPKNNITSG